MKTAQEIQHDKESYDNDFNPHLNQIILNATQNSELKNNFMIIINSMVNRNHGKSYCLHYLKGT